MDSGVSAPRFSSAVNDMLPLPQRVAGLLEAESGFNDAPSVILVLLVAAGEERLVSVGDVEQQLVLELLQQRVGLDGRFQLGFQRLQPARRGFRFDDGVRAGVPGEPDCGGLGAG